MKRYCFDTSGISNPAETMPQDIHESMWKKVHEIVESGCIAVTTEIYEEMIHIEGPVGECIRNNKDRMVLEVGDVSWDWESYLRCAKEIQAAHHDFISEYTGGSPKTICLNDISIIALSKALGLPLVSMESLLTAPEATKRRIPNVCQIESVEHLWFNDFLRREGIRL